MEFSCPDMSGIFRAQISGAPRTGRATRFTGSISTTPCGEPSVVIPVTAVVDDDGLVQIEGDDLSLVRWNHRPALLSAALQCFGGMADWKPRWHVLAVPTEAFMGSARSVFNLAAPGERSECYVVRSTNPNHLVPSAPSPTNVSPLRIAARYAAGRLRAPRRVQR
jgi:hypothetical protein